LYTKQTQLERMAAEKAAQQLAHERQMAHAKDDAERVKRYSCHCVALCVVLMLAKIYIVTIARGWETSTCKQGIAARTACIVCLLSSKHNDSRP